MDKVILILLLLPSLTLSQWNLENTLGDDNGIFHYISVVDSGTVWVVGEAWTGDTNMIYRRTGNGIWKGVPRYGIVSNQKLSCIAGIDSMTAFVATGYSYNNGNYLYKTTNGGANWFVQINLAGNTGYFNDIRFSRKNPAYGYAWCDPPQGNGSPLKIYKTSNYGNNWIEYSFLLDSEYVGYSYSMCVTDSLHAWFGLFKRTGFLTYGKVLYTTNGGTDFLISSLPSFGDEISTLEFKYDNNFGFSTLPNQNNYYYKSTNGGSTWISQSSAFGFGSATRIKWIPNTNVWYVSIHNLGPDNRIFKTTNDGAVWTTMNLPNQQFTIVDMDAISYNNKIFAYAIGLDGQVIRLDDSATVIGINNISSEIPSSYKLEQNYPNPFNPVTNINFSIPKAGYTSIRIYDILGKLVSTLFEEQLAPGSYKADWDASQMPSGIYLYRIESGSYTQSRKLILIK
jgi:photosystem II stability/assembly factor-like uncharacterized protein